MTLTLCDPDIVSSRWGPEWDSVHPLGRKCTPQWFSTRKRGGEKSGSAIYCVVQTFHGGHVTRSRPQFLRIRFLCSSWSAHTPQHMTLSVAVRSRSDGHYAPLHNICLVFGILEESQYRFRAGTMCTTPLRDSNFPKYSNLRECLLLSHQFPLEGAPENRFAFGVVDV